MANTINWEKEPDILALAMKDRFLLKTGRLAEWHRKGLLPEPKPIGLGKGKGTVTCYPPGTTKQVFDLLRLRQVFGRNFPMIGWMLAVGGYDVDQRYWKDPVTEVLADWTGFENLLEMEEDGSLHPSEKLYQIVDDPDGQLVLRRSPLWPMLKRMRLHDRDTFFRVIANVRLGYPDLTGTWVEEDAKKDLHLIGLALGLSRPGKKKKEPLLWDGREIQTIEVTTELNNLANRIKETDFKSYVEGSSDDALLLGLRRLSLLVWLNRDRLTSHDHRFTISAAAMMYTEKPKRHATLALLGAFYFNLFTNRN